MPLEAKSSESEQSPKSGSHPCPSDADILIGLERRENWAAIALFDRLESAVECSLYRVLQQRDHNFEDLVQICFERIVRTLRDRKFNADCSLATWASAIAAHVAIDSLRARTRERKLFEQSGLESTEHLCTNHNCGVGRVELRAEVASLRDVLLQMNHGQAEAIYLHDLMGHSLAEIASISGTSVAAVQSRLVRGRKEFLRRAGRRENEGSSE